jgi:hypothetical protein
MVVEWDEWGTTLRWRKFLETFFHCQFISTKGGSGKKSMDDADRCAAGGILEKLFRRPAWQADAAV